MLSPTMLLRVRGTLGQMRWVRGPTVRANTMTEHTFEREKLCYEQNFQQARSLNEQMNRVPTLSITLTGGLWFGAAQNIAVQIQFTLLLLAGIANFALVLVAYRIRDVLQSYFEQIKAFHEPSYADGRPSKPILGRFGSYSMITVYCLLMFLAGSMSIVGAFFFYWPFSFSRWLGFLITIVMLIVMFWVFERIRQNKKGEV